ncbi:probable serine/threonine-protein kinase cdc7 isoform X2 [Calliphora vicina]|uniref:probable serine/threonine-protein kinase cdc7 isoform X2 n=1 Tax=Calliphora vicina TaxID=7373 RepID=UPI00325A9731
METVTDISESNSPPTQLILTTTTATITTTTNNNNNNSNNTNNNNNNNDNTNNNNSINIDTQLLQRQQQQQLHSLYATSLDQNAISRTTTNTNFVAIPLSERPPIICISQQQQNGNNNHQHENYSNTSLTRSKSCLVRWRQCCLNFFTKIMGSNNPSEADRYEYYDYKTLKSK